jgi:hypothetical protein
MQSMKLPLTIIVWGLLVVVILTKANNVYAEWIIPSQLNEAYKNAQHYSSNSNSSSTASIPTAIGQDHNSTTTRTTTTAISSSLCTNSITLQHHIFQKNCLVR